MLLFFLQPTEHIEVPNIGPHVEKLGDLCTKHKTKNGSICINELCRPLSKLNIKSVLNISCL